MKNNYVTKGEKRRGEIYNYIKEQIESFGYPPSIREICSYVGLKSPSTAYMHMKMLEEQGLIKFQPGKKRAYSVVSERQATVDVPVIGEVTAGIPILAVENITGYVPFSKNVLGNRDVFALEIVGMSMKNCGIMDGDTVIVEKTPVAADGDIVVALIDDEATVKRFFKEKDYVRLQPENEDFEPILCDDVSILGKVIASVRTYI